MPLMKCRMLPPTAGKNLTARVNGRTYTGVTGTPQDIEEPDALVLEANGWTRVRGYVGTTTERNAMSTVGLPRGTEWMDTTLAYKVVWDGATWRRPDTGAAV